NPPVRSRLETLMGSNVVRLTDRKYMLRLVAKIRQDYENHQQKRIEERKRYFSVTSIKQWRALTTTSHFVVPGNLNVTYG
ncbi:hypothetical protein PV325_010943, partial [Microctonus aethiopoides]